MFLKKIEPIRLFVQERTPKELEYKVEKLKYKKLEVMQPRIRIKSELPVGE